MDVPCDVALNDMLAVVKRSAVATRGLCRFKIVPVVGHVHGLRETLRVCVATANVALTLMKYTHAYII